jgi:starch-binding outer membrane protein, SusD/RagB family
MKNSMKHILRLPLVLLVFVVVSISCERPWVDPWPPDGARLPDDVWENYNFARGFLERVLGEQMFTANVNELEGEGHPASASDEAKHSVRNGRINAFTDGSWSPTRGVQWRFGGSYANYIRSPWENSFVAVRRINIFLANIDRSVIIDDPAIPARQFDRTWYKGQAYFLRGWFNFQLFQRYGAFPIITDVLDLANDDIFIPRNTLQECYDHIIADLDTAYTLLPYMHDDNNWHRPTKTIAQALKARVQIYYASPLYQGDPETQPYGLPAESQGDPQRWEDALNTVVAAINENSFYQMMNVLSWVRQPLSGVTSVGTLTIRLNYTVVPTQRESIWSTVQSSQMRPTQHEWELNNMPDGVVGARGLTNPTQEMVDAFEVVPLRAGLYRTVAGASSQKFDWDNPVHAADPYANRDPRFYHAINYNGVVWGTNASYRFTVDTYEGGIHNDQTRPNATKTGYYMRKGLTEAFHSYETGRFSAQTRFRNQIRLPELLFIYAEAMNELHGPDVAAAGTQLRTITLGTVNYNITTAREAVNLVRARVEMPLLPTGMSQEDMRDAIKHERRIELCFEGHRMFDLRRWKEGEKLGGPIHGIKITPSGFDANNRPMLPYTYERFKVEDRVWEDKMYWWPIPYSEVVKYNGKLKQNPGW